MYYKRNKKKGGKKLYVHSLKKLQSEKVKFNIASLLVESIKKKNKKLELQVLVSIFQSSIH